MTSTLTQPAPFVPADMVEPILLNQLSSTLNPLSCLSMLTQLNDRGSLHDAAQTAVQRLNSFLTTQSLADRSVYKSKHKPPPHGCCHNTLDFKHMPIIWDTGASQGLTPFLNDFIHYEPAHIPVRDVSKVNYVTRIGTVMYKFRATNGDDIFLPGVAFHLPSAEIRLLSPQSYHQRWGGSSTVDGKIVRMTLPNKCQHPNHVLEFPLTEQSNVPTLVGVSCTKEERTKIGPWLRSALVRTVLNFDSKCCTEVDDFEYEFQTMSTIFASVGPLGSVGNTNLSSGQKELLLWHWRLGISMSRVQELMVPHRAKDQNGMVDLMPSVITPKFATSATCVIPKCAACELSRARKRSAAVVKQHAIEEKEGILSANQYSPGDLVSLDQYVCATPGRLYSGYGREAEHNRFHGGTIFNDAASGAIWIENQVSLGANETVCAKARFEEWLYELSCAEVKRYHSDNGVFSADEFRDDCDSKFQKQTFSGVGAKHQNGRAERAIQTVMYMARTFMIHTSLHWNERGTDDIALWPFAVRHAVWLHNRLPNHVTGLSPIEILTGTRSDHRDLRRTHVWGCPVYVLDPKLQDGKKIPKWNRRSRQGQFLGFSDEHSSLVANVRHLTTGHVSPQFHVVFDDHFHTV